MEEKKYLISDASRLVKVESHVLRYWEEELALPIKRNELGHRFYTSDDILCFQEIKKMKEQGLQLRAIRMYLKNGKIYREPGQIDSLISIEHKESTELEKEEKKLRIQQLVRELFADVLRENNEEICKTLKETMLKELDYQFRLNEERDEEHYKKIDDLLRARTKENTEQKKRKKHLF